MNPTMILAVLVVLLVWLAAAFAIWYWGPRRWSRFLLCPEKNLPARVLMERKEGSFGSLKVTDVKECSLFPGEAVVCDKHCVG